MVTRYEVIQDLCPFEFTDFGQRFQLDNNLFVADTAEFFVNLESRPDDLLRLIVHCRIIET
jgi:hypothetical protein